ncbi:MAG TPA: GNAT family N-acetyltransferase [Ignavibacteriaceae bacterium]
MNKVVNDIYGSRFVLDIDGSEVYVLYAKDKDVIELYSTYTPPDLRGQGLAEKVVLAALIYAEENNLKIIPGCWYVRKILEKHTKFQSLVIK